MIHRSDPRPGRSAHPTEAEPQARLRETLQSIDGASYGQYKRLLGHRYCIGEFVLIVDRVPPDPFAGAAQARIVAPTEVAGFDARLAPDRRGRIAVEDWLSRRARSVLEQMHGDRERGGLRPGSVRLQELGAAVVERSACRITDEAVELRLLIELPAAGRRIRGRQAVDLLCTALPRLCKATLLFSSRAREEAALAVAHVEDHHAIQQELERHGLVAFLARGSLLARASGAGGDDDSPRKDGLEVPLAVPDSLTVSLELPHAGRVEGLGIPAGVTLIVGGAFHGKSTLAEAIARGVYPHRPGDGRERVATVPEAVTIRAEDGRAVRGVDISGFLGTLPSGVIARRFTTDRASGATSQAASIMEAVEMRARLLLMDEDRCATNFMVRDGRMQRLVPKPEEPVTPLIDRVRELHERYGVSSILVTGGSGDYLGVADTVIRMKDYQAWDATRRAREIATSTSSMRLVEDVPDLEPPARREPRFEESRRRSGRPLRFGTRGPRALRAGEETIDLLALEQIVETGQVRALARWLPALIRRARPGADLSELIDEFERRLDERGLDDLDHPASYDLSRPRRFELAAAANRWRALRFTQGDS